MSTAVPLADLRKSPTACLFEGGDEIPVSMFVTEHPRRRARRSLHDATGWIVSVHPSPRAQQTWL